MRVSPAVRTLGIVTLVLAALLGSAYALGRSLVPDPSGRGVTTSATGPHYADQPSTDSGRPSPDQGPHSGGAPNETDQSEQAEQGEPGGQASQTGVPPNTGETYGAHATTGTATVALTFDDGPHPHYTPQVLDILREYQVTATFCVVGENAQNHPDLIRAIVADGHTLCNHTWNHDVRLGSRSPDRIRADLIRTSEAIHAAAPDAPISYYRQPGGAWTYEVVSVAEELGMVPLHWTVDTSDWQLPGAGRIAASVITGVEPGSVVLMHDAGGDRQGTVDALHRILPDLTSRFQVGAMPTGRT
ncbi:polysaccharide deacetylase family protein [Micromonospora endolithica]|uniref:Polysaccharide deacetylase family protein n=1 Tax=Micromonospora endolithica TaxID=230091 RepID=A0A3A9YV14_9ACTN|nr:polysaccharide deacetylase family protein [Micromonospora endolithica]RKN39097.1 polysaccharide deacetylase family protein [Micromonospora endolithica]TWJ25596.1 polysaccharide deacetylase [Micromonospora endolithica]